MQVRQSYSYPETPEMIQVNVYDNTRWNRGSGTKSDRQFITEAVPKGQTVHNWKEIITMQYYSKSADNYSISQHLKEKQVLLKNACPNISFKVLSETETEAVYKWSIKDCKGQEDQFEVARFIKTEHGIHRVSYAQKSKAHDIAEHNKWLKIVKEAYVVKI